MAVDIPARSPPISSAEVVVMARMSSPVGVSSSTISSACRQRGWVRDRARAQQSFSGGMGSPHTTSNHAYSTPYSLHTCGEHTKQTDDTQSETAHDRTSSPPHRGQHRSQVLHHRQGAHQVEPKSLSSWRLWHEGMGADKTR